MGVLHPPPSVFPQIQVPSNNHCPFSSHLSGSLSAGQTYSNGLVEVPPPSVVPLKGENSSNKWYQCAAQMTSKSPVDYANLGHPDLSLLFSQTGLNSYPPSGHRPFGIDVRRQASSDTRTLCRQQSTLTWTAQPASYSSLEGSTKRSHDQYRENQLEGAAAVTDTSSPKKKSKAD